MTDDFAQKDRARLALHVGRLMRDAGLETREARLRQRAATGFGACLKAFLAAERRVRPDTDGFRRLRV